MEIWMLQGMAISLGLTLFFELIFACFFKVWGKRETLLVVFVNVLTNPIVVFSYYMNFAHPFGDALILTVVMEVWAIVTEALLYKKYSKKVLHPWLFSIGANAFSYFIGEVINSL